MVTTCMLSSIKYISPALLFNNSFLKSLEHSQHRYPNSTGLMQMVTHLLSKSGTKREHVYTVCLCYTVTNEL